MATSEHGAGEHEQASGAGMTVAELNEARAGDPRTVLQEKLIDVYSACVRPRFGVESP
ncbi:MAG: hypothetical protein ACOC6J_10220 [Spirochaetota bacterium]